MIVLRRGMIIDVNLDPIKGSETGKHSPKYPEANQPFLTLFE